MANNVVQRLSPELDQLKALLRDALKTLETGTVANIIEELAEQFFNDPGLNGVDRLEVHMMLVGILTVMTESIEAGEANA